MYFSNISIPINLTSHDVIEVLKCDETIVISVCTFEHVLNFSVSHLFPQILCNSLELIPSDSTLFVPVVQVEHLLDVGTRILVTDPLSGHIQKLIEVNALKLFTIMNLQSYPHPAQPGLDK